MILNKTGRNKVKNIMKRVRLVREILLVYAIWVSAAIVMTNLMPDWLSIIILFIFWSTYPQMMIYNLKIKAEADLSDYLDEALSDPGVQDSLITLVTDLNSIEGLRVAKEYDLRSQEWIDLVLDQGEDNDGN